MNMVCTPAENLNNSLTIPAKAKNEAGLAPLLLTVLELVRQLMEAQVIRRMEEDLLSEPDLERAADSLQKLEEQILHLCKTFDVDPADLNINLGDVGTLLPSSIRSTFKHGNCCRW